MILIDTREKKNDHIIRYLDRHKIPWKKSKLDTADYTIDGKILVERKGSLNEICGNLFLKKNKIRFHAEMRRAVESGAKLYIVIEAPSNITCIRDVARDWPQRRSRVPPKVMMHELEKLEMTYQIKILFCTKRNAGRLIMHILEGKCE